MWDKGLLRAHLLDSNHTGLRERLKAHYAGLDIQDKHELREYLHSQGTYFVEFQQKSQLLSDPFTNVGPLCFSRGKRELRGIHTWVQYGFLRAWESLPSLQGHVCKVLWLPSSKIVGLPSPLPRAHLLLGAEPLYQAHLTMSHWVPTEKDLPRLWYSHDPTTYRNLLKTCNTNSWAFWPRRDGIGFDGHWDQVPHKNRVQVLWELATTLHSHRNKLGYEPGGMTYQDLFEKPL